jgi:glucose-6-phosphate-specific signal transduction histidine kinase
MNKIKNTLLLSCLRATELIEKRLHFKLSLGEKIALRLHISMCQACQLYEKQSAFIDRGLSSSLAKKEAFKDIEALKLKIHKELEKTEG